MRMLGNHVLAQPIPYDRDGLIHLTEKMKFTMELGKPRVMTVLAVGPGRPTRKGYVPPPECAPGDRIIVHSYTTGPVDLPDGKCVITRDQIIAVLPKL